jgi:16S rRNA (cytidine1402-2'-O)-methyltransferase
LAHQLYLIPTVLSEETEHVIPEYVKALVSELHYFIAENAKTARRYLRRIGFTKNFDQEVKILDLSERQSNTAIKQFLNQVPEGQSVGVLSEAGCPGIADPGADIVRLGHALGWQVIPLVGPSSILMTLISSGMNGQVFTFHGYLPIEKTERIKKIKDIVSVATKTGYTQLFMETPYRNNGLLQDLLEQCPGEMYLCIASDLTGAQQMVQTKTIQEWKKNTPSLHKIPTVFSLNF